jgi:hypothetical protein
MVPTSDVLSAQELLMRAQQRSPHIIPIQMVKLVNREYRMRQ